MDQYSVTSSEGWFSRIGESIKGVLFGLLIFVLSFPLIWWNEGRAVQTAESLDEGAGAVISVEATKVDGGNEGKLVHLSGMASTTDVHKDADFGVEEKSIKLLRSVEMYQWVEKKKSKKKKKLGGKKETTTTYTYKREWSQKWRDSDDFEIAKGHTNPPMRYEEMTRTAQNVAVGAFTLPSSMIDQISGATNIELDEAAREKATPAVRDSIKVANGSFYFRPEGAAADIDPTAPEVGDHRVSFAVVRASDISLIAQQIGSSFKPYQTKAGDPLSIVKMGRATASEMFQAAQESNATLTWVLRGVAFFMMFLGITLIFRPLVVVADVVPLFGSALGIGSMFVALIISLPLTLLTIGISWVAARPLLGGALLAGAVALLVGGFLLARKVKAKKATAGMMPALADAGGAGAQPPRGPGNNTPGGFGS